MVVATFTNEQTVDWKKPQNEKILRGKIAEIQSEFSRHYPLIIGGQPIYSEKEIPSYNPSNHKQILGYSSQATRRDIEEAVVYAWKAFEKWKSKTSQERADYLFKAADVIRKRKPELVAWHVMEAGKNWVESDGEINEAIDFLEMYARKAMEMEKDVDLIKQPGIDNKLQYLPLGVGVIIPPWNFPFAILTGMTAGAIVTGNTVLVKPSSVTPIIASKFMEIMAEINLPDGVVNFVPGSSKEIGDFMVGHRDINFISFTGSKEAGVHIDEVAHKKIEKQRWIKRVITEMGGKDGIVVDESADLEAAAKAIVVSAFGFQGQKCSAGSRAIIHENVYEPLIEEIISRTKDLTQGSPVDNCEIGPVIDRSSFAKISQYIEVGKKEAVLACGGETDDSVGYFIEPTIFIDAPADSRIMKEEIFGPVLAICKVSSVQEGIQVFNNTEYGLTGSLFTKNRDHMEYAQKNMVCGNLFFNGKCTGAVVGVQPFGGYYMSGTGAKTGSLDYLKHFVQSKTISENL
ncbi:L-glutamate gamma-semialdehyde dehydrogenase [Bacillus subtilis]|uniref:L-glutamate gamma-semialdehyde dehydrogenase n=1 Tax=Bacillus subtilis TaxID=1423 RepID=UPI000E73773E|nr:L-glutamate gamma-semialdehyde dehydrogenase [Bacillus subtilis]RJS56705.1 1-pyrroline-5-carboxylate dehydrogenase [Bacillus subtilis]RPK11606.1 Delta-1-pyrroline-5-carboxylate dehydrogenase [Bacillus subtilis]